MQIIVFFKLSVINSLIAIFHRRQYEIKNQFTKTRKSKLKASQNYRVRLIIQKQAYLSLNKKQTAISRTVLKSTTAIFIYQIIYIICVQIVPIACSVHIKIYLQKKFEMQ